MEVGFNYPWTSNDPITIGPNIHEKGKPHAWEATGSLLDKNLATLRAAGVTVVRMWLLAHGVNYDGTVHYYTGSNDARRWTFEPPSWLNSKFIEDLELMLSKFQKAEMRMIPVLLDFGFFDEAEAWSRQYFTSGTTPTNLNFGRGRRAVAEDPQYRATFVEGTIKPLCASIAKYAKIVLAVDIVNEPYWCVSPITGSLFGAAVQQNPFTALLQDCVRTVHAAGLPSTIGHRYYRDITNVFSSVTVTRPQFHYYAHSFSPDALPILNGLTGTRPFLGEFGCITKGELDALEHDAQKRGDKNVLGQVSGLRLTQDPWPALQRSHKGDTPYNVLADRLDWLADFGYELAVVWPNAILPDPVRDDLKIDKLRLAQITDFTRRRP